MVGFRTVGKACADRTLGAEVRAWRAAAKSLAEWTDEHVVNRRDVWGAYVPTHRRRNEDLKSWTAPCKRDRGRVVLTTQHLHSHFAGSEVLGLHASDGERSRWFAFDFDAHDGSSRAAATNAEQAARLTVLLREAGMFPLIEDSDGRGGVHVWVLLDHPAPSRDVFQYACGLRNELRISCETFPKQDSIPVGGFGNWLRLPGRHHTRAHWSRFERNGYWLAGDHAVAAWVSAPLTPASLVPSASSEVANRSAKASSRSASTPSLPSDRERAIRRYVAQVPHGGEGSNRSGKAFHLSRFLRALEIDEVAALAVLEWWNAGNTPPLASPRLEQAWRNAAKYNSRPLTLRVVA